MGTWGTGSFDNDEASDWVDELAQSTQPDFVELTLRNVVDSGEAYLEANIAQQAIAAADVVASALTGHSEGLPDDVVEWLQENSSADIAGLAPLALRAIQRVRSASELRDLYDEAGQTESWLKEVDKLEVRLRHS